MLELARRYQAEAGVENVEFLKGEKEDIPLPDGHVDVVISNFVINLSTEKQRVIGEAFRVLKPGAGQGPVCRLRRRFPRREEQVAPWGRAERRAVVGVRLGSAGERRV